MAKTAEDLRNALSLDEFYLYCSQWKHPPPPQSYGSSEREDSAEREKAKVLNFPSNSLIKCLIQISFRLES